jgi:hypothetical protein
VSSALLGLPAVDDTLAADVQKRLVTVEEALRDARDVPEALAAVGAELTRPDAGSQLLSVEFWQRAVRDPDVRAAFVASRHRLRARVAEAVAAFLADHIERCRHLQSIMRSLSVDGADLAGLMIAVRELRSLAD